jgi:hypothetical protein
MKYFKLAKFINYTIKQMELTDYKIKILLMMNIGISSAKDRW